LKKKLSGAAKSLRKRSTDVEQLLWRNIRAGQIDGVKFRRQQPIGPYIVDFVSLGNGIIIELDGGQHKTSQEEDEERDAWFRKQGFTVLRFWNSEVIQDMNAILEVVKNSLIEAPSPLPSPTRGEGN